MVNMAESYCDYMLRWLEMAMMFVCEVVESWCRGLLRSAEGLVVVLQLKGTAKYNNTLLTLIPTYLKTDCLVACKKRCVESVRIRPSSPPRVVGLAFAIRLLKGMAWAVIIPMRTFIQLVTSRKGYMKCYGCV